MAGRRQIPHGVEGLCGARRGSGGNGWALNHAPHVCIEPAICAVSSPAVANAKPYLCCNADTRMLQKLPSLKLGEYIVSEGPKQLSEMDAANVATWLTARARLQA